MGGVLTGLFAKAEVCGTEGALYGNGMQLIYQLYGILFAIAWSGGVSFCILVVIKYTIGLTPVSDEDNDSSIDGSNHNSVPQSSNHAGVSQHGGFPPPTFQPQQKALNVSQHSARKKISVIPMSYASLTALQSSTGNNGQQHAVMDSNLVHAQRLQSTSRTPIAVVMQPADMHGTVH